MKVLAGDGVGSSRRLLCRVVWVAWLVSSCPVEVRKSEAEPVTDVCGAAALLLEDWVLDNSSPNSTMLIVASFEGMVLLLGERATLLATRLLEDGSSIWQGGADYGRPVSLGIWIVLLICVWKVSAEARRLELEGRQI